MWELVKSMFSLFGLLVDLFTIVWCVLKQKFLAKEPTLK